MNIKQIINVVCNQIKKKYQQMKSIVCYFIEGSKMSGFKICYGYLILKDYIR